LFPQARDWFRLVASARFDVDSTGRLVPDYGSLIHRRIRRADNAGRALLPRFPPTFDGPIGVGDYDHPEVGIDMVSLEARPVRVSVEDGVIVYADAYVDTDVFYKATPTHVDEYFLLRSTAAPTTFRFRVETRHGVAAVRQSGNSLEVHDARGGAWLRAAAPIAVDRSKRKVFGTVQLEGDVVTLSVDTSTLEPPILVDPDWKSTGDMAYGRFYHRALDLGGGRILATGGCSAGICSGDLRLASCPTVLTFAEVLDLESRTWSVVGETVVPRYLHAAESLPDGRVLVAGGCMDSGCAEPTAEVELYDPAAGGFTSTAALAEARAGSGSAHLDDGRILIAGGCTLSGCSPLTELYDPASGHFASGALSLQARGRATTTKLADGRILMAGGCATIGCESVLASAEVYDPKTDRWAVAGPMSTARAGHAAAPLPDGRVIVAGGCADIGCATVLASSEFFDPSTDTFTPGPPLGSARFGALALPLPNGGALFSEGCEGHSICDLSNEVFTLATQTFALTVPAVTARAFHDLLYVPERSSVVAVGGCQPTTCSWWNETWDVSDLVDAGAPIDAGAPVDAGEADSAAPDAAPPGDAEPPGDAAPLGDAEPPGDAAPPDGEALDAEAPRGCTLPARTLAAGWDHTLEIDRAGSLWGWGQNSEGELGTGNKDATGAPVAVTTGTTFTQVAGGARHSCAIRDDETLWCWGANYEGQLGLGDLASRTRPEQVGSDADWIGIVSGGLHTCGLRADASIWCWGANAVGQLGRDGGPNQTVPVPVLADGPWEQLSATARHTCAVRWDNSLWCWGDNSDGQLGTGDTDVRLTPVPVAPEVSWSRVATGALHTCALDQTANLWCWGANMNGQLGTGDTTPRLLPAKLGSDTTWTRVDGGFEHTCGIRAGALYCWGDGARGQLGLGASETMASPTRVGTGSDWSDVATGAAHTCGLARGTISCWGDSTWGQVTGAVGTPQTTPVTTCGSPEPTVPETGTPATHSRAYPQCGCRVGHSHATVWLPFWLVLCVLIARRGAHRAGANPARAS
jgi:alpha-tubulin suppressor-like RCC1 family protein